MLSARSLATHMPVRSSPFVGRCAKDCKYILLLILLLPPLLLLHFQPIRSSPARSSVFSQAIYPVAHLLNFQSYLPDSPNSTSGVELSPAIANHVRRNPDSFLTQYSHISPACPRQPYVPHLLQAITLHRIYTNPRAILQTNTALLILLEPADPFTSNKTSLTLSYIHRIIPLTERFETISILAQPSYANQMTQMELDANYLQSFLRSFNVPVTTLPPMSTDDALHLLHGTAHLLVHHGPLSALAAVITRGTVYHTRAFRSYMDRDEFKWQIRNAVFVDSSISPERGHKLLLSLGEVEPSCCLFEKFGQGDGEKVLCSNARSFGGEKCWIVSLGCGGKWQFERAITERTDCMVHTFDCTGDWSVPKDLKARVKLHKACIGLRDDSRKNYMSWEEIIQLENEMPTMLKMDVEGMEYPVLTEMLSGAEEQLPEQMVVEVHVRDESKTVKLFQNLAQRGYRFVHRADNPFCPFCSEITLVRQLALPTPLNHFGVQQK